MLCWDKYLVALLVVAFSQVINESCEEFELKNNACIVSQVHHGGAGTTAAGLKAAVNESLPLFGRLLIFIDIYLESNIFSPLPLNSAQQPLCLSLGISSFGEKGCMQEGLALHPSQLKSSLGRSWLVQ